MIDRKQDIKQLVSTIESLHKQHEGDMEIIRVLVEQHERDQEELSAIRQELVLSRKETETCNLKTLGILSILQSKRNLPERLILPNVITVIFL